MLTSLSGAGASRAWVGGGRADDACEGDVGRGWNGPAIDSGPG